MQSLQDISIKNKMMVLTMLAVLTAVTLACTAFVINHVCLIKNDTAEQLSVLANIVGADISAALSSDDNKTATRMLSSLKLQPMVTVAALYSVEGQVFATYPEDLAPGKLPPLPPLFGSQLRQGHMEVVEPVIENNEQIGTVFLQSDLAFIWRELFLYAVIVLIVMIVSCGAAYLLTSRLQTIISGPILHLTHTAELISQNNDYTIRVHKTGNDELGALCEKFNQMLDQVESSNVALEQAQNQLEIRVQDRTRELSEANSELSKEIVERARAEKELENIHREFADSARKAGMAEIATGVLHNVGNVLNSVNVSATMLTNHIKTSKVSQLKQVMELMNQHEADMAAFITTDEKGKQVPRFLKVLTEHLVSDEKSLLEEAESLISNVDHIKTIITTQQSYATSGGLVEPIAVNVLLDDALRIHAGSFGRHGIQVERDYADLPTILIDKQRVIQIVINLVKNAKEALLEQAEGRRHLRIRTRAVKERLIVEVSDTGVGIDKAQVSRIFSHGFTTKTNGHGFGLHSSANAATEMEGKLSVQSGGHLNGATFTLDLPFVPASVEV